MLCWTSIQYGGLKQVTCLWLSSDNPTAKKVIYHKTLTLWPNAVSSLWYRDDLSIWHHKVTSLLAHSVRQVLHCDVLMTSTADIIMWPHCELVCTSHLNAWPRCDVTMTSLSWDHSVSLKWYHCEYGVKSCVDWDLAVLEQYPWIIILPIKHDTLCQCWFNVGPSFNVGPEEDNNMYRT